MQLTHNSEELIESIEGLVSRVNYTGFDSTVELRRHAHVFHDVAIMFNDITSKGQILELLSTDPRVTCMRHKGGRITFRFADEVLADLGSNLEAGYFHASTHLLGKQYLVDFCDPNATKALHLGHLRNIALGNAIVSCLRAAGATVFSQSVICDIGRNVAEAMAGYSQFQWCKEPSCKTDHFVGRCYSEYVRTHDDKVNVVGTDMPLARELQIRNDTAQRLLESWMQCDPGTRGLWMVVREWVLAGQRQTLDRLGIKIDSPLYESEVFDTITQLTKQGIDRGVFSRTSEGAIIYETRRKEYPTVPLVRSDGFPTEHMRAVAVWHLLQPRAEALDACVHVMGDEWVPATIHWESILSHFSSCPLYKIYQKLPYAMVRVGGSTMKSSTGDVVLIDDLLDRLIATQEVVELAPNSSTDREAVARIVCLGFFLARAANKTVDFDSDRFFQDDYNPGWVLAKAWSKARSASPPRSDATVGDLTDSSYRFLVLQSQHMNRMLRRTLYSFDSSLFTDYLIHLARWYIAVPVSASIDRVARTILTAGLSTLGLLSVDAMEADQCFDYARQRREGMMSVD